MTESTVAAARQQYDELSAGVESTTFAAKPTLERLNLLEATASSLLVVANQTQNVVQLRQVIELFERAVDTAPFESPRHGMAVMSLCAALGTLYRWTADDKVWQESVEAASRWTHAVSAPDWRAPLYLLAEAILLYHRSHATESDSDTTAAIEALNSVRSKVRRGSGVYCTATTLLAELQLAAYRRTHSPEELERALRNAVEVVDSPHAQKNERRICLGVLAEAFILRYESGRSVGDLDAAITAGTQGQSEAVSDADAVEFVERLATARRHRYKALREPADLHAAIDAYSHVVQFAELAGDATQRAVSLDNYGNGIAERYGLTGSTSDLLEAIAVSRAALAMLPDSSPHCARLLSNLGRHLIEQYETTRDGAAISEAVDVIRRAVKQSVNDILLASRLCLALGQALLYEATTSETPAGLLREALDNFVRGRDVALAPARGVPIYERRTHESALTFADYEVAALLWLAELDAESGEGLVRQALEVAESTKDRILAEHYAKGALSPPPGVSQRLIGEEQFYLAQLNALDDSESAGRTGSPERSAYHTTHREHALQRLNVVWNEMIAETPTAARYVAMRRSPDRAWFDGIKELDPGTVVLSLLSVPNTRQDSDLKTQGLAVIGLRAGTPPVVVGRAQIDHVSTAAQRFREEVLEDCGRGLRDETWSDALSHLLRRPSQSLRPGCRRLIVSPPRHGRDLPWHLVLQRAGWQADDDSPLAVTTIPTLAMLRQKTAEASHDAGETTHTRQSPMRWVNILDEDDATAALERMRLGDWSGGPLIVGNPTGDLPAAESEARDVAHMLGVEPFIGPTATVARVRSALRGAPIIHLATHAQFDGVNPMNSVIRLADGAITAKDLIGTYCDADLVVLSACEGASARRGIGGEVVGLANALLRSGAGTAVAPLWRANDRATAFLMTLFYDGRLSGLDDAAALADAMKATSNQPSWRHPYYWSGFIVLRAG